MKALHEAVQLKTKFSVDCKCWRCLNLGVSVKDCFRYGVRLTKDRGYVCYKGGTTPDLLIRNSFNKGTRYIMEL